MRQALSFVTVTALLILFAAPAQAKKYPEPSVYPLSWQLDFKHGKPMRIVVASEPYWYMTYTVTNNTRQEQVWRPDFQLVTDDGKVVKSDHGIPKEAFETIKAREGNKLLESASQIAGPLRQGEDQAKDGVAIWKEPAARMGAFKIFVGGLSGEFVILKDDDGKPILGDDKLPLMLRKTLQLDYAVYGDEYYPGRDEVHDLGQKWVMR